MFLLPENITELEHPEEVGSERVDFNQGTARRGWAALGLPTPIVTLLEIQDGASNKFSFNGPPCISSLKDKVRYPKVKRPTIAASFHVANSLFDGKATRFSAYPSKLDLMSDRGFVPFARK